MLAINSVFAFQALFNGRDMCPFLELSLIKKLSYSMASLKLIVSFLCLMALATTEFAICQSLKAHISCLNCDSDYDFSGNKIVVKCDKVKKLVVISTKSDGSFETMLPSSKCTAKLIGGPHQLYASKKDMISNIVKTQINSYTISTPIKFFACKLEDKIKCDSMKEFGDSKTIDLPLPPEWGLAPSSYYLPVLPIIGIP